ncbi:MAG: glutamate-1-semialdehyde 2,1-aminomutase [Candidatus Omnitrophica bacterium]|nr:glutamate-1-semialdehyde 2,1-aminomutase [Candidatus Omnitrophota bacterium]
MTKTTNEACWKEAQQYLVGGVNSPVRSFRQVGGRPFFVDRGAGSYLWDVEGKRYLDLVGSWGALILGHRHADVIRAAEEALRRGTSFGTPTPQETALARAVTRAVPTMEQVRFVSSGTEAVMSAVRLARAATGRRKILKFDGGYHGHLDALLTKAGSGMATLGLPASPGVPAGVTQDTVTVPFNDLEGVERAVRRHGKDLACVLVEPVLANIGVIPPAPGFLQGLRRLTRRARALLIFDEVITGFRVGYGGAQGLFGVEPDLTVLGKVIGGGFPIGAYGGGRRWMRLVAPAGPVYQAGTLAGHPVAMAAGLATLAALRRPGTYAQLDLMGRTLRTGLVLLAQKQGVPVTVNQVGGLVSLFFTEGPVRDRAEVERADPRAYARYFRGMLSRGIYLPPSPFEAWFLSTAFGVRELRITHQAHADVIASEAKQSRKIASSALRASSQ